MFIPNGKAVGSLFLRQSRRKFSNPNCENLLFIINSSRATCCIIILKPKPVNKNLCFILLNFVKHQKASAYYRNHGGLLWLWKVCCCFLKTSSYFLPTSRKKLLFHRQDLRRLPAPEKSQKRRQKSKRYTCRTQSSPCRTYSQKIRQLR